MNVTQYRELLGNTSKSDEEVFLALLQLVGDDAPDIPEDVMDGLRNDTMEKRPDVVARLHAYILEAHSSCCCNKQKLAKEAGVTPDTSYLDIARALQQNS